MSNTDTNEQAPLSHQAFQLGSNLVLSSAHIVSADLLTEELRCLRRLAKQIARADTELVVFVNTNRTIISTHESQPGFATNLAPTGWLASGGIGTQWAVNACAQSVPGIGVWPDNDLYFPVQATSAIVAGSPFTTFGPPQPRGPESDLISLWSGWGERFSFSVWSLPQSDTSPSEPADSATIVVDEAHNYAVAVRLDEVPGLRDHLVRRIRHRRRVLRRSLPQKQGTLRRRPARRALALVLIAVTRHYGRRSESDDDALLAHRWISVIGGEPALSC